MRVSDGGDASIHPVPRISRSVICLSGDGEGDGAGDDEGGDCDRDREDEDEDEDPDNDDGEDAERETGPHKGEEQYCGFPFTTSPGIQTDGADGEDEDEDEDEDESAPSGTIATSP